MSEPLSCSQALLSQIPPRTPTTWTEAFDKVLRDVLEQCRPGYVEIPTDAVHHQVSAEGLKTKPVDLDPWMRSHSLMMLLVSLIHIPHLLLNQQRHRYPRLVGIRR